MSRWPWIAGLLAAAQVAAEPLSVQSPDGRIDVRVDINEHQNAIYRVNFDGAEVVRPSRLGLRFAAHPHLDTDLEIVGSAASTSDLRWEQPWGERRWVRDHHNELRVDFAADEPERRFSVRFRVFNDGVGFRYEVPDRPGFAEVSIVDELTEFHLPRESTAFWIPGRRFNRYEYLYRTTALDAVEQAHTPMTVRLDSGVHVSLHEAALVDYAAYVLDQRRPGVFQTDLTPWSDGIRVRTSAPFTTPWRTIQIAPDAIGLLNSDLILNLNEPNALGDVSWVEPGKYIGIWWAMHIRTRTWGSGPEHGANTKEVIEHLDFAAEHGFSGVLVEGWNLGWDGDWFHNGDVFRFAEPYPDFDIEKIAAHAREKGVRLIGHHETSGNVTNYEQQMDAALDLYERVGVRVVKTGYVADASDIKRVDADGQPHYEWHDGQFMVNHYARSVKAAAKRRISINAHEPIKDTGLRRTYPNFMTREGARGQEFNAWGDPPNSPEHTALLPYTRMLSGPMDFTPGIFNLTFQGPAGRNRVQTTLAKQLALYVVLYSPLQMAADLLENYEARMDAFQFIKDVPADWEHSAALAGEVGDFVVIARQERGGREWFLGAITDENARSLEIPLTFLAPGVSYVAEIYRDGPDAHYWDNPYDLVIEQRDVVQGDVLDLSLGAGGGAAVRFRIRG